MPLEHQAALKLKAAVYPQVQIDEFTDDLMSYIAAVDAVVAMGWLQHNLRFSQWLSHHENSAFVQKIWQIWGF